MFQVACGLWTKWHKRESTSSLLTSSVVVLDTKTSRFLPSSETVKTLQYSRVPNLLTLPIPLWMRQTSPTFALEVSSFHFWGKNVNCCMHLISSVLMFSLNFSCSMYLSAMEISEVHCFAEWLGKMKWFGVMWFWLTQEIGLELR